MKLKRVFLCDEIQDAESYIAYLSIRLADTMWDNLQQVLVKTDSQSFKDVWNEGFANDDDGEDKSAFQRTVEAIRGYTQDHGIDVRIVWVPAHRSGQHTEAYFNRQADRMATEAIEPYLNGKELPQSAERDGDFSIEQFRSQVQLD